MNDETNLMRSLLFVPGNRPDRFGKARESGADIYCIDLEDAVPSAEKTSARKIAMAYIAERSKEPSGKARCYLRINSLLTTDGLEDLLALSCAAKQNLLPDGIVLPMATSAFEIEQLTQALGHHRLLRIIPMVETPKGLDNLSSILAESDCIEAVAFGFADYAAATGSDMSWDALLTARSRIIATVSSFGLPCFDGPWFDISNLTGLKNETEGICRLGFRGKLAIHPSQVTTINKAFMPSDDQIEWARQLISASKEAGGGVTLVNGVMIDKPLIEQAKRVLASSGEQEA